MSSGRANSYRIEVLVEGAWVISEAALSPELAASYYEERDRSCLHDTRIVCEHTLEVF